MTEAEIHTELARIAVSEIGKKYVASSSVRSTVDFDGGEALEILIVLKPEAPTVSGKIYSSVLLKAYDFLHAQEDSRRPGLSLDRAPIASTAK